MKTNDFEDLKSSSLAHQIIKIGRFIHKEGLNNAKKLFDQKSLTQSHLDLFPYIDRDGTSISEIAKRKGVTKQAVSKLVKEMLAMDLLELKVSKVDARIKHVYFKTKGPHSIQNGFKALQLIDKDLLEIMGDKDYKVLLKNLGKLLENFE